MQNGFDKLAMKLLSSITEHYPIYLCQDLEEIVTEVIVPRLNSSDEVIQFYSLQTVCYFAEFLSPDINEYHEEFLNKALTMISQLP